MHVKEPWWNVFGKNCTGGSSRDVTLGELLALGVLREVWGLSAGRRRYDTNAGLHHHLFCTRCHRLVDIERDFEDLRLKPEEATGYQIMRHRVTFFGICPACQQAAEDERGALE